MKATSLPAAENTGEVSRSRLGLSQVIVRAAKSKTPTNECSLRALTNASFLPSGEKVMDAMRP